MKSRLVRNAISAIALAAGVLSGASRLLCAEVQRQLAVQSAAPAVVDVAAPIQENKSTFGMGRESSSRRERGGEASRRYDRDGRHDESKKTDETSREKSFGVEFANETSTKDGNVTTTDKTTGGGKFTRTENTDNTASKDGKHPDGKPEKGRAVSIEYGREHGQKVDTGNAWGDHAKGEAGYTYGGGGKVSIGTGGVDAEGHVGVGGSAKIEVGGETPKIGNEYANASISGKGAIEAEIAAKLAAEFKANKDEFIANAGGEIGVSVGIQGEVSVNMELLGVPVTVKAEGEASVGAEAKAKIGFGLEGGKFYVVMEAGAVLGAGLKGHVTVEVGAKELLALADTVGKKVIDTTLSTFTDYDPEYTQDLLNTPSVSEMIEKILRHEIEKNKEWRKSGGGAQMLDNVLQMINRGADFGTVYQYLVAALSGDSQKAGKLLGKIREQIGNGGGSSGGQAGGGPLDNPNPDAGEGYGGATAPAGERSKPIGLTPFKY